MSRSTVSHSFQQMNYLHHSLWQCSHEETVAKANAPPSVETVARPQVGTACEMFVRLSGQHSGCSYENEAECGR